MTELIDSTPAQDNVPNGEDAPTEVTVFRSFQTAATLERKAETAQLSKFSERMEKKLRRQVQADESDEENAEPPTGVHHSRPRPAQDRAETTRAEMAKALVKCARDITRVDKSQEKAAWRAQAKEHPEHTANRWRSCWEKTVRPLYAKMLREKKDKRAQEDRKH